MHLRAIKLRGFKSFPDPVEIRLEPGVAVTRRTSPGGAGPEPVADQLRRFREHLLVDEERLGHE